MDNNCYVDARTGTLLRRRKMKRLVFLASFLTVISLLISCSDATDSNSTKNEQNNELDNSALTFEIGDIVLIDGEPQGIVFYVDNNKTSGKILSLNYELTQFCGLYTKACSLDYGNTLVAKSSSSYGQDNFDIWTRELPDFTGSSYYNAWYWCKYIKGLDWYIPARNEIKEICSSLEKINTATEWLNSNGWEAQYFIENLTWSSTPRSLNTSYDPYRLTMYFSSSTASMLCNETKFHCQPVRLFSNMIDGIGKIKVTPHTHNFSNSWSKDDTYHWHACSGCSEKEDKEYHQYGDWVITKEASEQEEGQKHRECSVCHYKEVAAINKLEHTHTVTQNWKNDDIYHWKECTSCSEIINKEKHTWLVVKEPTVFEPGEANCVCSICGKNLNKTTIIPRLFCETPIDCNTKSAATKQSEKIYFGDFPRTVVRQNEDGNILYGKDNSTIITIDESESNAIKKGNYTYYIGSDGEYYVKVQEQAYSSPTYSDGTSVNHIKDNKTRWFRIEPIMWKIITTEYDIDFSNSDNSDLACLLLAEEVITAGVSYFESSQNHPNGKRANNYEHSQMRAYLNGISYNSFDSVNTNIWTNKGFMQTAFSQTAQDLILQTKVKNNIESTMYDGGLTPTTSNIYICPVTNDKIFLLSLQEVTIQSYGFGAYEVQNGVPDLPRVRKATDFAKANSAWQDTDSPSYGCSWWCRSPCANYFDMVDGVMGTGNAALIINAKEKTYGIVPAMTVILQ